MDGLLAEQELRRLDRVAVDTDASLFEGVPGLLSDDDFLAFVADDGRVGQTFLIEHVDDTVADDHRYQAVGGPEVEADDHRVPPSSFNRATSCWIAVNARSTNSSATGVLPLRRA